MSKPFWTFERVCMLRQMWIYATASQIAAELRCTRNMVIGNAYRLGLVLSDEEMARRKLIGPTPKANKRAAARLRKLWRDPAWSKKMRARMVRAHQQRAASASL